MINPRNIDPPSGSDKVNLDQAILDIIERVGAISSALGDVQQDVETVASQLSTDSTSISALSQEITEARLGSQSLKEKLTELQTRQITMTNLRPSYVKTITKEEGKIVKEVYSGGIEQEIRYLYTGDILSEKQLYINNLMVGNLVYSISPEGNFIETNNGFDTFNIGSDSIHLASINTKTNQILDLNIANRLLTLESKTATGNFDGKVITDNVKELSLKVANLEMIAFNEIDSIINFPQITTRIQTLEFENENEANIDEFVFDGTMVLNLTGIIMVDVEVTCDGIEFSKGQSGDFGISEDKQQIILYSKPILGSTIRCKYY